MDQRKSFVIGIGGVTNGGKTTLANKLQKLLPDSTYLCQDDFFWAEDSPVWKDKNIWLSHYNYGNWDCDESIDFDRLVQHIQQWKNQPRDKDTTCARVLLIDGFLLYRNRQLCSLFDKKFFITLPYEECRKRRVARTYLPPEPNGYFEEIAWPAYEQFRQDIAKQEDVVYLSGETDPDEVMEFVVKEIQNVIQ